MSYKISHNLKKYLFIAYFFSGLGWMLVTPIFENFDETVHLSSILEKLSKPLDQKFFNEKFILEKISNYPGPEKYSSGIAPFSTENTYDNFFISEKNINNLKKYNSKILIEDLENFSEFFNWQSQHPPLYYNMVSLCYFFVSDLTLENTLYISRFFSFLLVMIGLIIFINKSLVFSDANNKLSKIIFLGFASYPLLFPTFFVEFTRIGNDSLCLFLNCILASQLIRYPKIKLSIFSTIFLGVILFLGLLTKAFFLFIAIALYVYFFLHFRKISLIIRASIIITIPILFGLTWYIYMFYAQNYLGLGYEANNLFQGNNRLGMILSNFEFLSFLRAICVPIVTFIWSGTWSLVHIPYYFYLPFFLVILSLANIRIPKNFVCFRSIKIFFLICLALLFMGLVIHILITFGIGQVPTSPGWYLHILMPGLAIILGSKIHYYLNSIEKIPVHLKINIVYLFIFPFVIFFLNALLFSGFVIKSPLKKYALMNNDFYSLINHIDKIYSNLSLISYPLLGLFFMIMGYSFFGYVFYMLVKLKKR